MDNFSEVLEQTKAVLKPSNGSFESRGLEVSRLNREGFCLTYLLQTIPNT